jgi:ABC-type nickel/cobalt efflux system permease component RcnA
MTSELTILLASAASIGLVHTVLGPDHYVPFVAMARGNGWTLRRTLWITAICGLGHVLGSVALGVVGVAAGITLRHLEVFESSRGEVAGWLLMAFGLAYFAWSMVRMARGRAHIHVHRHADGTAHVHPHDHHGAHAHAHIHRGGNLVPWSLFIIFVLGPCEPLIPLLMFPAATLGSAAVALVAAVFGLVTIGTMLAIVAVSCLGMKAVISERWGRFGQPAAGALVFLCGVAIRLGL